VAHRCARGARDFDRVLEQTLVHSLDGLFALDGRLIWDHQDRIVGINGGHGCRIAGIICGGELVTEGIERRYVSGDISLLL